MSEKTATEKFNEALAKRDRDTYVDVEKLIERIMKEAPKEKRYIVAKELLQAGADKAKDKGDSCIMLDVIPAIARSYPQDEGIIGICTKAAQHRQDDGLLASVLLIHNPNDERAARYLMSAMLATAKGDPNEEAIFERDASQWKFLHTSDGQDVVLDTIKRFPNNKAIARKACMIMQSFKDIADPVRARWTSTIVEANPGDERIVKMAFGQADKTDWWHGKLGILSSIAKANQDNPRVLNVIRNHAEQTRLGYPETTNEYRGKLLSLTCPLDEKMSYRLIAMAHNATNDAKIDIFSRVLEANPNNEDIAISILTGPFNYSGIGRNTGSTVSEVFSKALEVNPGNKNLLKIAVERARQIKKDPEVQGTRFIDESIDKWTQEDERKSLLKTMADKKSVNKE